MNNPYDLHEVAQMRQSSAFNIKVEDARAYLQAHPLAPLDGPRECPSCQRTMSRREATEQGLCNDCLSGDR